jgi:hypothetical protein
MELPFAWDIRVRHLRDPNARGGASGKTTIIDLRWKARPQPVMRFLSLREIEAALAE